MIILDNEELNRGINRDNIELNKQHSKMIVRYLTELCINSFYIHRLLLYKNKYVTKNNIRKYYHLSIEVFINKLLTNTLDK